MMLRRSTLGMTMLRLLITGCTDSMRWYSGKVGDYVPYKGMVYNPQEYKSVDDGGFVNFVQIEDAKIEDTDCDVN
jgi:hypothetical protein